MDPRLGMYHHERDQVPPSDTFSNSSNLQQKRTAEDTIADVGASGLGPGKVVTEVTAAGPFWEARTSPPCSS